MLDRIRKTDTMNMLYQIQRCNRLRDVTTRFLQQFAKTRAFAPSNNSRRRLSRHSCEEREFRLGSSRLQRIGKGRRKERFSGER